MCSACSATTCTTCYDSGNAVNEGVDCSCPDKALSLPMKTYAVRVIHPALHVVHAINVTHAPPPLISYLPRTAHVRALP
jgi:hypothetical protein